MAPSPMRDTSRPPIEMCFMAMWLLSLALLPEALEAVRDLGSFVPLVRELCHCQGEWLQVSGNPQWSRVHGLETDITNQARRDAFRVLVVPAVQKAGPAASPSLCVEYVE